MSIETPHATLGLAVPVQVPAVVRDRSGHLRLTEVCVRIRSLVRVTHVEPGETVARIVGKTSSDDLLDGGSDSFLLPVRSRDLLRASRTILPKPGSDPEVEADDPDEVPQALAALGITIQGKPPIRAKLDAAVRAIERDLVILGAPGVPVRFARRVGEPLYAVSGHEQRRRARVCHLDPAASAEGSDGLAYWSALELPALRAAYPNIAMGREIVVIDPTRFRRDPQAERASARIAGEVVRAFMQEVDALKVRPAAAKAALPARGPAPHRGRGPARDLGLGARAHGSVGRSWVSGGRAPSGD